MKIVVLGVTGMLGHKMLQTLEKAFPGQVYGFMRGSKARLIPFNLVSADHLIENVDVENTSSLIKALNSLKPQYVINCTGITIRKLERDSIQKNFAINSVVPQILSFWCNQNQAKLIHFSTDCVFNGERGNYSESDMPDAEDVYGRSKYLGETPHHPSALTIRLSIVGRELFGKTELIEWFLSQRNKTISGYSEVYYSGVTTNFASREVVRIIQKFPNLSGLYQVSSEKISKYDLLVIANKVFKANVEIKNDASKKSDKSLNCDLYIKATQFTKPRWQDMLTELAEDTAHYEKV